MYAWSEILQNTSKNRCCLNLDDAYTECISNSVSPQFRIHSSLNFPTFLHPLFSPHFLPCDEANSMYGAIPAIVHLCLFVSFIRESCKRSRKDNKNAPATDVVLLISLAVLLLVSLSVPIIHSIWLMRANIHAGVSFLSLSVSDSITFGVWGLCLGPGQAHLFGLKLDSNGDCTKPKLGYSTEFA